MSIDTLTPNATPVESAIRSTQFRGGEPIKLEDGQVWFFPKPKLQYRPRFKAEDATRTTLSTDLGTAFNAAIEALDGDDSTQSFMVSLFDTAASMLRYNYNIDDETLEKILVFRTDDPDNEEVWRAITGTARGTYSSKA